MDSHGIFVVAAAVFGFGLVSRRLERTVLTPPMLFTGFGLLAGAHVLNLLPVHAENEAIHLLAELTLVLILFGDAARIDLRALRRELGLPVRLLLLGLPLTIALGGGIALVLLDHLSVWEAMLIGVILAPTDAALGQAVVSSAVVPQRIRQALNVESGLNDGIALPVIMVFIALASMTVAETRTASEWVVFALLQITLGPLAGIAIGWLGGKLLVSGTQRNWVNGSLERLAGLALALLAFTGAEAIGGNGFIAAFTAGMTLGNSARNLCSPLYHFLESEGQLLMLMVFLLVGVSMAWPALTAATPEVFLYGVLSLTVVRMLPVAVAMVGSGLRGPSFVFLGWFGPRGLASILFVILVVEEGELAAGETIFTTVIVTVLFSILAHGLTAVPGSNWYGAMVAKNRTSCRSELQPVAEHPLRVRMESDDDAAAVDTPSASG